jgi:hypothetical protein
MFLAKVQESPKQAQRLPQKPKPLIFNDFVIFIVVFGVLEIYIEINRFGQGVGRGRGQGQGGRIWGLPQKAQKAQRNFSSA